MKNLNYFSLIILLTTFVVNSLVAQSSAFNVEETSNWANLTTDQNKIFSYVSNLPRIGNIKRISWLQTLEDDNGNIVISLPNQNNGQPIIFEVLGSYFSTAKEYAIVGKSPQGEIAMYITEEGKGGTIDLFKTSYQIYPISKSEGILIEVRLNDETSASCEQKSLELLETQQSFCDTDCGASVVDVLALVTPPARLWLDNNFGTFSNWFLFMETNNINTAFILSEIQGKRVRVRTLDYTTNFAL